MYNPSQPRVPAGDTSHHGGRWTDGGAQLASMAAPAIGMGTAAMGARTGLGPLNPAMLHYLHGLLKRMVAGSPLYIYGGLLIAAIDELQAAHGALPGHPDIHYRYKDGVLTLVQDVPGDSKPLLFHGPAGADGLYRLPDGTVIGHDLGSGILLSEEASGKEKRRRAIARAAAITEALRRGAELDVKDEPDICPAATGAQENNKNPDWGPYQEQVTKISRKEEIHLNGVSYDGCKNVPGGIILLEAKGPGYSKHLKGGELPVWYGGKVDLAIQLKKLWFHIFKDLLNN